MRLILNRARVWIEYGYPDGDVSAIRFSAGLSTLHHGERLQTTGNTSRTTRTQSGAVSSVLSRGYNHGPSLGAHIRPPDIK
jgi:hypothetical protein